MIDIVDRFNGEQKSCFQIKNCGAVLGGECFLIQTDSANILIDSGYGFCAEKTVENIRNTLNEKPLNYILLTHSHYDHAMGSARCKCAYPDAQVVASEYCAHILHKPSARAAIRKMDNAAAEIYGMPEAPDLTDKLNVDISVKDGDILKIGDYKVKIIALPGHTKCCVGYYFIEQQALISCETIGLYAGGSTAMPGCLVGYQMTLDSYDKIFALPMKEMLVSHSGMLYGDMIYDFLKSAKQCTEECKQLIVDAWKSGASNSDIVELFKNKYYTKDVSRFYPEPALLANLAAQIPMFINECG